MQEETRREDQADAMLRAHEPHGLPARRFFFFRFLNFFDFAKSFFPAARGELSEAGDFVAFTPLRVVIHFT